MIIKKEVMDDGDTSEAIATEELEIMPSEEDEIDNAVPDEGHGESVAGGSSRCFDTSRDYSQIHSVGHINGGLLTKEPVQMRDAPKVPLLECQYCETWYLSAETFRQHAALHRTRNLDTIYNCRQCLRGFCTKEQLQVHERNHSDAKPFKCEVCNEKFSFLRSLEYHVQIHGGVRVYKCQICDKIFLQLYELNIHLKYHATFDNVPQTQSTQPYPSIMSNGLAVAPSWKRGHDGQKNVSQNISDPGNLLKPVEMLTTEERVKREEQDDLIEIVDEYNPQDCNDENNSEENMIDLLPRNTGTSSSMDDCKFTCNRCGLDFKYFRLLQLHKKTRKGVRCPECSQKFCSSKLLEDHLADHAREHQQFIDNHEAATRRVVNVPQQNRLNLKDCFVCNRELKESTDENIVRFQGGTFYKCNDCINISLDTTVKRELIEDTMSRVFEGHGVFTKDDTDDNVVQEEEQMEVRSETSNEGGFQCSHCKINFGGEFALRAHRRKTVERNCPKCDMPFCNIKLLRRHMKDHEEENIKNISSHHIPPQPSKSFETVVRPQRYPNRSFETDGYNRSIESFDKSFENSYVGTSSEIEIKKIGDDRFSCTKCGKVVTGKGALAAHMAHTHAEKRTICQHCGKAFAFEKILNMHLAYRQRISFPVGCRYCPHRYRNQAEVDAHEEFHMRSDGQKKLLQMMEGNSVKATVGQNQEETHEIARSDGNILIIRKKKMRGNEPQLPIVLDDKYFQGMFTEKNGLYHCNQCPNSYRARGGIKAHIYHSHREKPYTCMYCRMPFPFEKMLEFHLRRRKDLKCDVCNNRFCSYGKLEEHVKTHMLKQEKVSMSKTNDALIKRVMQNSEIEIALVRDEKKTVVKEESLKKSEVKEVKPAPIAPPVVEQKCPLCSKVMGKRDVLNDHITTHLKRVGEYFRCKDCDCKYLYPIYLVRHYKNRKVSQCELCQKVFCSDINMANHDCPGQSLKRQRTQSASSEEEILPKRVSRVNGILGRMTNTSAGVRGNTITHDWEGMLDENKPCKCNFCGRIYGKPGGLGQHLSTLHAVDTFPCKNCNTIFSSLTYLIKHKNTSCENSAISRQIINEKANEREEKEGKEEDPSASVDDLKGTVDESVEDPPEAEIVPIVKKTSQCPVCMERFEQRCGLSAHIRLKHKDARPYECEECGRCFQYEKALEIHRKVHDEDPPPVRRRRRRGRRNVLQDDDSLTVALKMESQAETEELDNVQAETEELDNLQAETEELNNVQEETEELDNVQTENEENEELHNVQPETEELDNDQEENEELDNVQAEAIDMDIDEELTPGFDATGQSIDQDVKQD